VAQIYCKPILLPFWHWVRVPPAPQVAGRSRSIGIFASGRGEDGAAAPHRHEGAVPVSHAVEIVARRRAA
jgi:hypothetical protein